MNCRRKWIAFFLALLTAAVGTMLIARNTSAQARGGTLRIIYPQEPPHLNPAITVTFPTLILTTKIFNGLLEYEGDFKPKPSLAERWSVSNDGRTYTFHLRKGVTFHDGKPFTSADVKFSVELLRRHHPRAILFLAELDRVETPNANTAVVVFKKPLPGFIRMLGASELPILPKHVYSVGDIRSHAANQKPVGTGPFTFADAVKGSHVSLARNESYWKSGRPYLDRLVLQFVPDPAGRVAVIEKGDADLAPWSSIPNVELTRLSKLPHLEVTTRGYEAFATVLYVEMNTQRPPFKDVRVRRAVAHSLDQRAIRQSIWFGLGKPASSPMTSVMGAFHNPNVTEYKYDLKKAEQLLDEAGLRRAPDGTRFRITQYTLPYGEEYARVGEYIKAQLAKIGIVVNTEPMDLPTYLKRVYADYDFTLHSTFFSNFVDPIMGLERYFHSGAIRKGVPFVNITYRNREVDALLDSARIEVDASKRKQMYDKAQDIIVADAPFVFLLEVQWTTVAKKDLANVVVGPWGVYDSFDEMYWR